MISRVEALNYRCLRYVSQPLRPFQILVGPNASGKTTFLEVFAFVSDLLSNGLESAVEERTSNFADLTWGRQGSGFEIALETSIPGYIQEQVGRQGAVGAIRYELAIGANVDTGEIEIRSETVLLKPSSDTVRRERSLFPEELQPPETLRTLKKPKLTRTIVNKVPGGNDNFYSEVHPESGKGWAPSFRLGPRKSALANMPDDESRFPATTWFRALVREGLQRFVLNSAEIRKASPPGQARTFRPDGSNLPWVVQRLLDNNPEQFTSWLAHVRTALPDIVDIRTVERQDDKHRYLMIKYSSGLEVPSWAVSDGTLRLLALTLPAYLPDLSGIYLIEEPENGIHPQAVETVYQALSCVYSAQILVATHSTVMLSNAQPEDVLCFAKSESGATDIVVGSEHPRLKQWQGESNLGVLLARGVLA